jgi:tetratricopeptide (TPR) repeat protein
MIGLLVMIAWDAEALTKEWRMQGTILGLGATVLLSACLVLTWRRAHDWRNSGTLFRQALAVAPLNNFMAHACLGSYLVDEGKDAEAIEHFRETLKVAPAYYPADYGLGRALAAEGKWPEAAEHLQTAIKAYANYPVAHNRLGEVLAKLGKSDAAMEQYKLAIQLNPQFAEARLNLADLLAEMGKFPEAEAEALKVSGMAVSIGRPELVEAARRRAESYRAGRPYHEKK